MRVDAQRFLADWTSADELRARRAARDSDDERTVADLLVEQVEFANVLVLNKTDLVGDDEVERLTAMLLHLNPGARVIRACRGQVDPREVLGTGLFDFEEAARSPGWMRELRGEHMPETEEYGIESFVYRAARPMHPERLWAFLPALPEDQRPEDEETRAALDAAWDPVWGDRRQELVFMASTWPERSSHAASTPACSPREMAAGPSGWSRLDDPFPAWEQGEEVESEIETSQPTHLA
ncbi:CobW family GTP-binding protein [Sorangium sp. So ce1128]